MVSPILNSRVIELSETASTNADAMRLALAGEALPLWVIARRQTAGRGRAGRTWVSGEGNLQTSLAVICDAPLAMAAQLALVAGVALLDAVQSVSPGAHNIAPRLKWPNDILIGGSKAGGILVESTPALGQPGFLAVLGFGVNVATYPRDLGRAATSLSQHGVTANAGEIRTHLAAAMDRWLQVWRQSQGFHEVREAWMARGGEIGESITVQSASGPVTGTYQGLDATGALLASIDGRLQTVTYGDVMIVEPRPDGGSR